MNEDRNEVTLVDVLEEHFDPPKQTGERFFAALVIIALLSIGFACGYGLRDVYAKRELKRASTTMDTTGWTIVNASQVAPPDKVQQEKDAKIIKELTDFYRAANRVYFRDVLTKNKPIGLVSGESYWAMYSPFFTDNSSSKEINVDRSIATGNLRYAKLALLHEMAHAYVDLLNNSSEGDPHGEKFQKEMRRLANLGAFEGLW